MRWICLVSLLLFFYSCKRKTITPIKFDSKNYLFKDKLLADFQLSKEKGFTATKLSFISEYKALLQVLDRDSDTISAISDERWKSILDKYEIFDAKQYILDQAVDRKIIMFNEAHYIPTHRNFVTSLLPELREMGFEYLALEAIGMTENDGQFDKNIAKRGYPMTHSGYYLVEPEFSVLVRTASELGFKIIGYDQGSSYGYSGGEREVKGAENIIDYIEDVDGNISKTIVLCGWDHLKEGPSETYWEYALAARLKEYTGQDPLTINQTKYNESSSKLYEDSIYQHFDKNYPAVLVNNQNESFNIEEYSHWYDIMLFHPRTTFDENIPSWKEKRKNVKVDFDEIEINCPCKLLVFDENDDLTIAVPTYVSELNSTKETIKLPFRSSHDQVVITNKEDSYLIQ